MRRITPTTPAPAARSCSMCGGPARYLGVFAGGSHEGYGCEDRGCRHSWLVRRDA